MRPPPPLVRVIGHPTVSGLLLLVGMPFALACAFRGTDGLVMAGIVAALLERVMRANAKETEYRAWKSQWDSMGDQPARPKRGKVIVRTVIALAAGYYTLENIRDPQVLGAATLIVMALLLWFAVVIARRFGLRMGCRHRRPADELVAVVVRYQLMAIPPLSIAYKALPPHCQCLR